MNNVWVSREEDGVRQSNGQMSLKSLFCVTISLTMSHFPVCWSNAGVPLCTPYAYAVVLIRLLIVPFYSEMCSILDNKLYRITLLTPRKGVSHIGLFKQSRKGATPCKTICFVHLHTSFPFPRSPSALIHWIVLFWMPLNIEAPQGSVIGCFSSSYIS